ncbi:FAD binding domain-containing protein [Megasphaera vaginalis (ex Bordigoni et al. 2020)]|uniref:FAD binding domain-containing protein n=1 Tax=Megasphaera vaginalis (ex Bordigoni et al. 2020) TaxID=2045301 RepID=UPI000C7A4514|nr:FAD binding domain-containing protein [Megasphaera vaginalis (ex Bordigoni et al. 2020)]
MTIQENSYMPATPEEAYFMFQQTAGASFRAGGQRHRYEKTQPPLTIDLANTGLSYIRDGGDELAVGAMTTLSDLEANGAVAGIDGGVLPRALREIHDRRLKENATLGALLAVKAPFSMIIPILLTMHVDVELYGKGRMSLADYLGCPPLGDMITQIDIAKGSGYGAFFFYRSLPTDEPYLTGAASIRAGRWRIAVGGRPGMAVLAERAAAELTDKGMAARENVAHLASEELEFANYGTCSGAERKALTVEMVRYLAETAWKGYSCLETVR